MLENCSFEGHCGEKKQAWFSPAVSETEVLLPSGSEGHVYLLDGKPLNYCKYMMAIKASGLSE